MTRTTATNSNRNSWIPNNYPPARRSDHVDTYQSEKKGKVSVADPYQWLEDQYSDETKQFVDAQEIFTKTHLDKIPDCERLKKAFETVQNYPKFGFPSLKDDGRWYWTYNSGLQNHHVIYRSKNEPKFPGDASGTSPGEVFFDINLLSEDGATSMPLSAFSFDGKYFAYAISLQGSDFSTIYVRRTDPKSVFAWNEKGNGEKPSHDDMRLVDELKWVKFSPIEWTRNSKSEGFFYQRYPAPAHAGINGVNGTNGAGPKTKGIDTNENKHAKVYYHKLETTQDNDILVHEDPSNPDWMWGPDVTIDGKYLLLNVLKDSSSINQLWVTRLTDQKIDHNMKWKWTKLIDKFEAQYTLVCNKGPLFYIWTNKDAPTGKLVMMDIDKGIQSMVDIIPAQDAVIDHISCVNNDHFAVIYRRNVQSEIYIYKLDGTLVTQLAKDFVGSASIHSRERQQWFFVYMEGLTSPGVIKKYDFTKEEGKRWSTFYTTKVEGLNPDDFVAEQLWYESKDKTKIPMFILRHKSTPLNGTAAGIQYGYGGFDISLEPSFSPRVLLLCQVYGVIYAQPSIRGGGEFGKEWYEAGIRERKKNSYDDFVAATEHLVQKNYVQKGRVALWGASNGGLLVSASVNRAPVGTYSAALAEVGVHDLLKFDKFTIGGAWSSDYGVPSNPHDFDFIYPISPLHNVPPHELPAMLLLTADHDDRVVPMHSFKFAATLQHSHASNPHPLLLRVDVNAGHGAGKSTAQSIQESAHKWGFVAHALRLKWNENTKL